MTIIDKPQVSPVAAADTLAEQPAEKPKDGKIRRKRKKTPKAGPPKREGLNPTMHIRDKLPWTLKKF